MGQMCYFKKTERHGKPIAFWHETMEDVIFTCNPGLLVEILGTGQ